MLFQICWLINILADIGKKNCWVSAKAFNTLIIYVLLTNLLNYGASGLSSYIFGRKMKTMILSLNIGLSQLFLSMQYFTPFCLLFIQMTFQIMWNILNVYYVQMIPRLITAANLRELIRLIEEYVLEPQEHILYLLNFLTFVSLCYAGGIFKTMFKSCFLSGKNHLAVIYIFSVAV